MDDAVVTDSTITNIARIALRPAEPAVTFPTETIGFEVKEVDVPVAMTAEGWRCALWETEVSDNRQKLRARPFLAWGVAVLLVVQNLGIWFIVVWALNKGVLQDLQIIFGTLVAGSLTQSYFLLQLITEKVFGDINYHNGYDDSVQ